MGKYLTKIESNFISKTVYLAKPNQTIMDVGAEAGRFSLFAANSKANVVSIDLNLYALKRLKLKNKDVNIILSDARHLPLRSKVFDLVFMVEVLDYIPELVQSLQDCNRTLKPDASCILSFGNKSSLKAKLKAMRGKPYRHSYSEVSKCLAKTGFTIKNKLGYSWLPFGRTSQSKLVTMLEGLEWFLGLRRLVRFSPWVIIRAMKQS